MTRDPTRGLGVYMRDLASRLKDEPVQLGELAKGLYWPGSSTATKMAYADMTMVRLIERGIAEETDATGGFYKRGPRWQESARYYGWSRAVP